MTVCIVAPYNRLTDATFESEFDNVKNWVIGQGNMNVYNLDDFNYGTSNLILPFEYFQKMFEWLGDTQITNNTAMFLFMSGWRRDQLANQVNFFARAFGITRQQFLANI